MYTDHDEQKTCEVQKYEVNSEYLQTSRCNLTP